MQKRSIIPFLRESVNHWSNHRASRMGAALSYYTIFSIIPLLSLVIIIIGALVGKGYAQSALAAEITKLLGASGSSFIQSVIAQSYVSSHDILYSLISVGVLIVGTATVLYELKNAMDDLWNSPSGTKERSGWKYYTLSYLLSLSLIPVLIFLLLISLVFSAVLGLFGSYVSAHVGVTFLYKIGEIVFSYLVVSLLFAFVYRFLPNRKLPLREILWGALATAFLFMLGRLGIGLYVAELANASVFGAAGALVIMLVWIYYSVQIFFFGASLTYVYSQRYGYLKAHPEN